jgi:hypothetical protein
MRLTCWRASSFPQSRSIDECSIRLATSTGLFRHAALWADDDIAHLVTRLRQVWPEVVLHFRGDCAFGVPGMYEVCEGLTVSYTFGLSTNAVLQRETGGCWPRR